MGDMTSEVWDDELCHTVRLSPETIAAALADNSEALDTALAELDHWRKRAAELRQGLEPFAKLDAPRGPADNTWTYQAVRLGDVRRARELLGEG